MRKPFVAGNWKMNKTISEASVLAGGLRDRLGAAQGEGRADVVLCPPFTALSEVGRLLAGSSIGLGAQDLHWEPKGAFTGEISAQMLRDTGCAYVIVGHSERRHLLGEGDEAVRRKVAAAFGGGLLPILCVGESLDEREAGQTEQTVMTQLRAGTREVSPKEAHRLVVAYEPVWAIGTGMPATGEEANRVCGLIRGWLREWFGEAAAQVRILYGGSVTPESIVEFAGQDEIDGALVGGASLDEETFAAIVKRAARV